MPKQGRPSRDVSEGQKVTPVSRSVSPGGAAQPGMIEFKGSRPMYDNKPAFQSPPAKAREYNKGSQGKY